MCAAFQASGCFSRRALAKYSQQWVRIERKERASDAVYGQELCACEAGQYDVALRLAQRDQRLESNHSPAVSGFMWAIMLFGSAAVVVFCYMFGASHRGAHLIMTALVAAVIASMLVLTFELQYPFRGDLGIASTSWTALHDHIVDMDEHGVPAMRM